VPGPGSRPSRQLPGFSGSGCASCANQAHPPGCRGRVQGAVRPSIRYVGE
jgi:hypothetical protein